MFQLEISVLVDEKSDTFTDNIEESEEHLRMVFLLVRDLLTVDLLQGLKQLVTE
jgi:hypothetical protein